MSTAIQPSARHPRPWLLAWLGGALVPMAAGILILEGLGAILPPLPHRPQPASPQLDIIANAGPMIAAIGLPSTALLVLIMAFAERRTRRHFGIWMAAGIAATTPAALYVSGNGASVLLPLIYGFGLLGTASAYWIRHGDRTA